VATTVDAGSTDPPLPAALLLHAVAQQRIEVLPELFALCSSMHAAAKPIPQLLRVINIFIAQSL
jgi:hypothetical protein